MQNRSRVVSGAVVAAVSLMTLAGVAHAQRADESAVAASTSSMSADELADALIARDRGFVPDDKAGAESALKAAMTNDSSNARWPLALGILKMRDNKAADAKPYLEKATDLDPKNPDALNWHANALFSTINEASFLAKGRMAGQAKDMLERAVEIDPSYVDARIALVEFYRNAPGIAGGSKKKAKENAEAMLSYPDGKMHGHRLLAQLAIQDDDWAEANRHFEAAAEAAGDENGRLQLMLARGYAILNDKKDPSGALPILKEVYDARGDDADVSTVYMYARALSETGDCAGAIPLFERVLTMNPDARNTRYFLAECLAKQGQAPEAIAQYEEFVKRFPKDDNASKAKKAIKDLQKKR
jgi:tetratricopeptide (TPR) repeat protein